MSRIIPVRLNEFLYLVEYAQKHHADQNEPIPEIADSQHGKIRSCLETPFQTFGGRYLYPGFYPKAAILFYLLNKNHCLINGNKRLACLTLGYFCYTNKYGLDLSWKVFYDVAKEVTNSDPDDMEFVVKALQDTFRKFVKK